MGYVCTYVPCPLLAPRFFFINWMIFVVTFLIICGTDNVISHFILLFLPTKIEMKVLVSFIFISRIEMFYQYVQYRECNIANTCINGSMERQRLLTNFIEFKNVAHAICIYLLSLIVNCSRNRKITTFYIHLVIGGHFYGNFDLIKVLKQSTTIVSLCSHRSCRVKQSRLRRNFFLCWCFSSHDFYLYHTKTKHSPKILCQLDCYFERLRHSCYFWQDVRWLDNAQTNHILIYSYNSPVWLSQPVIRISHVQYKNTILIAFLSQTTNLKITTLCAHTQKLRERGRQT